jgi:raffinose/stachyose/melibiose transport system substrate-binding protein
LRKKREKDNFNFAGGCIVCLVIIIQRICEEYTAEHLNFKVEFLSIPDRLSETFDELIEACQRPKAAGISPVSTSGNEAWPLLRRMAFIPFRLKGNDYIETLKLGKAKMADPVGIQAARFFREPGTKYFQPGRATCDYNDALDTFVSGSAAMYYIGSWQFFSSV